MDESILINALRAISILLVTGIQIASFIVLLFATLDFRKVLNSRARFFVALGLSPISYHVTTKRLLLVLYVVFIFVATLILDLFFLFRPHLL